MKVTVKLFALLASYLPPGACDHAAEIEVPEGATPASVMKELNLPTGMSHLVLVNGVYVAPGERDKTALKPGDVLAVWPPVAGGTGAAPDQAHEPRPGPVTFEREMSITREDFLRVLARAAGPALAAASPAEGRGGRGDPAPAAPGAGGPPPYVVSGQTVAIGRGERRVELRLSEAGQRRLGSLELPAMRVAFAFFGFSGGEVERFMARFDAHFRRGGG